VLRYVGRVENFCTACRVVYHYSHYFQYFLLMLAGIASLVWKKIYYSIVHDICGRTRLHMLVEE